jgi:hypothetical protein
MAGIIIYLSILPLNVNDLNFPIKMHKIVGWIPLFVAYKKYISLTKVNTGLG